MKMLKESIKLWEGEEPLHIAGEESPVMHYYAAETRRGQGAVVILPGGGYTHRAGHEGEGYALYLNSIGVDAFVVDYRVLPYHFPAALLDARRAIRTVRANAEKWGIDADKIAVMGSSAGGHLAALVSTYKNSLEGEGVDATDNERYLPNGQILCYPVLDMWGSSGSFVNLLGNNYSAHKSYTPYYLADETTPPVFLWHTTPDRAVDVNGSYRYAIKLHELGVSTELHVYPIGNHGMGLANDEKHDVPYLTDWAKHLEKWLLLYGFVQ